MMMAEAWGNAADSSSAPAAPVLLRILLLVCFLPVASSFTVTSSSSTALRTSLAVASTSIAPELSSERKAYAVDVIDRVFGKEDSGTWDDRREAARATTLDKNDNEEKEQKGNDPTHRLLENIPDHELVYGELGIEALATILDAVGVREGDVFLDIGSGDGLLVVGAALLYPGYLRAARGIEIVPELYQRSLGFRDRFLEILRDEGNDDRTEGDDESPEVSFHLGNIYDANTNDNENNGTGGSASSLDFSESTLAVCFATT
mmetsp:Transcript_19222/g.53551  ORF Transcript_19222/g.53551 Transcript_19222/m.53551 type:complete len:261 (-) Transcript_19222:1946-2728(-)